MAEKLEYLISVKSELQEARAAADEITKQINAAKQAGQAYTELSAALSQVEQRMGQLETTARRTSQAIDRAAYEATPSQSTVSNPRANAASEDAALRNKSFALKAEIQRRNELKTAANDEIAAYTTLSPKTQEYIRNLKTQQVEVNSLIGNKLKLKSLIHAIAAEYPLLGAAMQSGLGRMGGLVMIGVYAIHKMRESINTMLSNVGSTAVWGSLEDVFRRERRAMEDADVAAQQYRRSLRRTAEEIDNASHRSEKLIQILGILASGLSKADEAKKGLEVARIEARELDPITRAQKLLEVEERYAARKLERARRTAQDEIRIKEIALQQEERAVEQQSKALEAARAKAAKLGTIEKLDAIEQEDRDRAKRSQEELETKIARVDFLKEKKLLGLLNPAEAYERDYLEQQLPYIEGTVMKARAKVAKDEQVFPAKRASISAAKDDVQFLEDQLRQTVGRRSQLTRDLPFEREKARLQFGADSEAYQAERASRLVDFSKPTDEVADAIRWARVRQSGYSPNGSWGPEAAAALRGYGLGSLPGGTASDENKNTARNTRDTVSELRALNQRLSGNIFQNNP